MKQVTDIFPRMPRPHEALPLPALALHAVISKNKTGVFASSDKLYKGAVFGRDSLEVAEDIMHLKPRLVRTILITLASLQGERYDDQSEEEPGKIVHEYRTVRINGKAIDEVSLRIFQRLSSKWGGDETTMTYYGSIDATPHFLRVLHAYCQVHGNKILDAVVGTRHTGTTITMREVALRASNWLLKKFGGSRSGFLEYRRRNPLGILNQVWKDSEEFYIHENGKIVNHNGPISSIEVQGLVYDALLAIADFIPEKAEDCRRQAYELRDRVISLLWQEDRHYFALGTDLDDHDEVRIIRTTSANAGSLLDTKLFDDLPEAERQKYVEGIVKKLFGKDFLTDAGIRSRSLAEAHLIPFWDYHGSFVSWPKETYDIAKGLRRQGLPKLAQQLENRLVNVVLKNRQYAEFSYVDGRGRILTHAPARQPHAKLFLVDSPNAPERIQAWTVSAIYAITTPRIEPKIKHFKKPPQAEWQRVLEAKILTNIPRVNRHLNPFALAARYPTYKYQLTRQKSL